MLAYPSTKIHVPLAAVIFHYEYNHLFARSREYWTALRSRLVYFEYFERFEGDASQPMYTTVDRCLTCFRRK